MIYLNEETIMVVNLYQKKEKTVMLLSTVTEWSWDNIIHKHEITFIYTSHKFFYIIRFVVNVN